MVRKSQPVAQPQRNLPQEVFLNLLCLADELTAQLADLLKPAELSPTQYNVLRILRGAGPDGMPCGEISDRMITREPDMTRLLDRLERRHLITRLRQTHDRRVVKAFLAPTGVTLLAPLDTPVLALHHHQFARLNKTHLRTLVALLEEIRAGT